eukprot:1422268-Heterocapsa_arctica.AAC.1
MRETRHCHGTEARILAAQGDLHLLRGVLLRDGVPDLAVDLQECHGEFRGVQGPAEIGWMVA